MNYKLSKFFVKLNEDKGLIENNSSGVVEVALATSQHPPIENSDNNLILKPHGKLTYTCKEGEIAYARAVTHVFSSQINVLEISNTECDLDGKLMSEETAQSIINKYK